MKWIPLTEGLHFFLSGNEDPDANALLEDENFLAIKREADALKITIGARNKASVIPGAIYCGVRFRGEKTFTPATCLSAMSETDKNAVNVIATKLEALLVAQHAAAINRNGLGHVMCNWR